MSKQKTKAIQKNLGTLRHNQAYQGSIRAYWSIFRALSNSGIIRTVAYLEPWHILNHKHIQSAGIFKIRDILRNLPNIYHKRIKKTDFFFTKNFQKIIIIFTVQTCRALYFIRYHGIFFNARKKESKLRV